MDNVSPSMSNPFQAPQGGWQPIQGPKENLSLGQQKEFLPQNQSKGFSQIQHGIQQPFPGNPGSSKNTEIIPVAYTPQKGLIVKQGEYLPEYGPQMYEWFASKKKTKLTYDTFTWKNGHVEEKERSVPNPPPHFSEFARTLGVTWATLKRWKKNNPEFAEYYEACEDIIQEFIVDNGIVGAYSSQFGIFAAKNLTKMKDVHVNKNENYDMKEVLDALEKGIDPNQSHDL